MNWIGLDIGVGYAFKIFELGLLSFSYAATQIGGAAGDGRTLTLIPDDPAAAGRGELAGRVTAVSRIDLRFLSIGFRVLFTDTWSIFGHGGVGWYREAFDAEDIEGTPGGFSRTGWDWMADIGVRYYLNDTFFAEGAFALGDDLSHDDSDLTTAFTVGLGVTWPDFLGIDRLIGGRDDGPEAPDDEAAPPDDLGSPEETP